LLAEIAFGAGEMSRDKCRFLRQAQDRLFDYASRDETARDFAKDDKFFIPTNPLS
jgi:hypothetical protein